MAFTVIGVFSTLRITLALIQKEIKLLIKARVSVKRVQDYLEAPDIDFLVKSESSRTFFEDASFSFPSDQLVAGDYDERFLSAM